MSDVEFPADFLGSPEEIGEVEAPFYQWLASESGPDDWHSFALGANWDQHGPALFEWIARQPNCDKATALTLFWKASPDYAVEFPDADYEYRGLVELIRDRWLSGMYRRNELAFEPGVDAWPPELEQLRSSVGDRLDDELPESMRAPLVGRRLDVDGDIEGIPARFWPEELR